MPARERKQLYRSTELASDEFEKPPGSWKPIGSGDMLQVLKTIRRGEPLSRTELVGFARLTPSDTRGEMVWRCRHRRLPRLPPGRPEHFRSIVRYRGFF